MEANRDRIFRSGEGDGKSGSFFFFSYDNQFLIKTVRPSEVKVLTNMLDSMISHIKFQDNKSLLARIYGLFKIKTNVFGQVNIILMQNTVFMKDNTNNKMTFDLKGSLLGRQVKLGLGDQKFWRKGFHSKKVLKDLNFIEMQKDHSTEVIQISNEDRNTIKASLKKDS